MALKIDEAIEWKSQFENVKNGENRNLRVFKNKQTNKNPHVFNQMWGTWGWKGRNKDESQQRQL